MASSGVSVAPESIQIFNDLKLGKNIKWIIYKIDIDGKEIVVDESSTDQDYEVFRQKLIGAGTQSIWKTVKDVEQTGIGGRYAVFDVAYEVEGGGKRNKIAFITWIPNDASIRPKMLYSTSKEALKRSLNGFHADIQAMDEEDLEWENVLKRVKKH